MELPFYRDNISIGSEISSYFNIIFTSVPDGTPQILFENPLFLFTDSNFNLPKQTMRIVRGVRNL
ncbi:MAG: hypothetical protein HVN35_02235 [Methanobacteriaceae archaeon]|nr:hypothetical protein [Methanobacteriaceae archaeon]